MVAVSVTVKCYGILLFVVDQHYQNLPYYYYIIIIVIMMLSLKDFVFIVTQKMPVSKFHATAALTLSHGMDFSEPVKSVREGTHAYTQITSDTQNMLKTKNEHQKQITNHQSKLHSREPWNHPLGTPPANTVHQGIQIEGLRDCNYGQWGWAEAEPSFSSHLEHAF